MKIEITDKQKQALVAFIDQGVRAVGVRAVREAAELLDAIAKAEDAENGQSDGNGAD